MAATATGGVAASIGTGAFTSTQAQRTVSIAVADDDDAYLSLDASDESGAVRSRDSAGELMFDIPGLASQAEGDGVGPNSTYVFGPLVEVRNQGADRIEFFSESPETLPQEVKRVLLTAPNNTVLEGEKNAVPLAAGESVSVGLLIQTAADLSPSPSGEKVDASVLIHADPVGVSNSDEGTPPSE